MYPFFDSFVEPLLSALSPEHIVEVGSEEGKTTLRLLDFCRQHGGTVTAIDPCPRFDVAAVGEEFGDQFTCHEALSLEAIPLLRDFDVVLLDGDHNWYTVYHELMALDHRAAEQNRPFPCTILHDIGWPYGRRDLYYDPDTIPAEFTQPYARRGMQPDQSALQTQGGMNAHLNNACREGGLRNGVRTGIEDFLRARDLEFLTIPGFCGLGVVFPAELRAKNAAFADLITDWELPPRVRAYIESLERSRLHAFSQAQTKAQQVAILCLQQRENSVAVP